MRQTMTRRIAVMLVAMIAVLMAMPGAALAQREGQAVTYVNMAAQQAIIVTETSMMTPAAGLMGNIDDAFVEEHMAGFFVRESATLSPVQLRAVDADAGKLFDVVNIEYAESALVLVLAEDDRMILLAYIGFASDRDFEMAIGFAADVVEDGWRNVQPPAGFTRQ